MNDNYYTGWPETREGLMEMFRRYIYIFGAENAAILFLDGVPYGEALEASQGASGCIELFQS